MATTGRQSSPRYSCVPRLRPPPASLQTKHHWWWKANQIFHNLDVTQHFTGTVLFLEEDHFVAEDFLHILSMMQQEQQNNFKEVFGQKKVEKFC